MVHFAYQQKTAALFEEGFEDENRHKCVNALNCLEVS